MNAPLRMGFVVRVGEGFVGRYEWSPRLVVFETVDRATVYETKSQAQGIADAVYSGLICGVAYGRIRVESLAEVR